MAHPLWLWSVAVVAGLLAGAAGFLALLRMPERWMRDTEPGPEPPPPLPSPRLRLLPFGLLWILACGALAALALDAYGPTPAALVCVLALVPLGVLFASDMMTRILPDQGVAALAAVGLACLVLNLFPAFRGAVPGAPAAGSPWWLDPVGRLGAAVAGGGLLLLVGWIGGRIAGAEAMGMGDVKLLAAAGLVSGLPGLIAVLLVSFVTGAVFAIPALVRKYGRRREDGTPPADGTMPFGPFLVLGVVAVLFFRDGLVRLADWYLSIF